MGVFERTKTNWKYIFILMVVTIIAGGVIFKAGKLKAHKIGKEFRIEKEEFNNFITKCLSNK